jgi:hypothetical protein
VTLDPPVVSVGADTEVRATERGWILRSKFAISIGGVRLDPGAERLVMTGDRFVLPDGEEIELAPPNEPADLATFQLALREVDRIVRERPSVHPCVVVAEGRELGSRIEIAEERRVYVIGRGGNAGLSLTDGDASREHCAVERRGDIVHVWDLGSKTGTFMGSQRISDVRVVWDPQTMLRIGKTVLRVTKPAPKVESGAATDEPAAVATSSAVDPSKPVAPAALPVPVGQAPVAAVPALTPTPKRQRDVAKIVVWIGASVLAIFSVVALVWIFR